MLYLISYTFVFIIYMVKKKTCLPFVSVLLKVLCISTFTLFTSIVSVSQKKGGLIGSQRYSTSAVIELTSYWTRNIPLNKHVDSNASQLHMWYLNLNTLFNTQANIWHFLRLSTWLIFFPRRHLPIPNHVYLSLLSLCCSQDRLYLCV